MSSDSGGVRRIANVTEVLSDAGVQHITGFTDVKSTTILTKDKVDAES